MGNNSSSELPLAGIICLAFVGYIALILIIVLIRFLCVRKGVCQNVECGICGKENDPRCSECCVNCNDSCGCNSPSLEGCLRSCCPNKKASCVDILLCQCCLGENNCFTNESRECECTCSFLPCKEDEETVTIRERLAEFFNCDGFSLPFCYNINCCDCERPECEHPDCCELPDSCESPDCDCLDCDDCSCEACEDCRVSCDCEDSVDNCKEKLRPEVNGQVGTITCCGMEYEIKAQRSCMHTHSVVAPAPISTEFPLTTTSEISQSSENSDADSLSETSSEYETNV